MSSSLTLLFPPKLHLVWLFPFTFPEACCKVDNNLSNLVVVFFSSIRRSPLGYCVQLQLHKFRRSMESSTRKTFSRKTDWLQNLVLLKWLREWQKSCAIELHNKYHNTDKPDYLYNVFHWSVSGKLWRNWTCEEIKGSNKCSRCRIFLKVEYWSWFVK